MKPSMDEKFQYGMPVIRSRARPNYVWGRYTCRSHRNFAKGLQGEKLSGRLPWQTRDYWPHLWECLLIHGVFSLIPDMNIFDGFSVT
jgi:hypothetical protein